jgi:hypothetical protein
VKACTLSMKCVYVCEREALLTIKKGLTVGKCNAQSGGARIQPAGFKPKRPNSDVSSFYMQEA